MLSETQSKVESKPYVISPVTWHINSRALNDPGPVTAIAEIITSTSKYII